MPPPSRGRAPRGSSRVSNRSGRCGRVRRSSWQTFPFAGHPVAPGHRLTPGNPRAVTAPATFFTSSFEAARYWRSTAGGAAIPSDRCAPARSLGPAVTRGRRQLPAPPVLPRRGQRRWRRWWLAPEEGEQVGVELILVGGGEAVWRARIVDFLRTLDEPGRFPGRVIDVDDLVVLT